ncbi:hypothetical protein ACQ4PT_052832 [Festuca glaucescens]
MVRLHSGGGCTNGRSEDNETTRDPECLSSSSENTRADGMNIDQMVAYMTEKLNFFLTLDISHENEIFKIGKVKSNIREVDRYSYEPVMISIGPYHHGTPAVLAMEKEKWFCLDYVLKLNQDKCLKDYLTTMEELEKQIRNSYSGEINMESGEFLQMILLDGCFLLVSFSGTGNVLFAQEFQERNVDRKLIRGDGTKARNSCTETGHDQFMMPTMDAEAFQQMLTSGILISHGNHIENNYHPETSKNCDDDKIGRWLASCYMHDLLLLENQIPFFVVKRIYELVAGKGKENLLVNKFAEHIEEIVSYYPKAVKGFCEPENFHHLLHLCHIYFRPTQNVEECHNHVKPHCAQNFLSLGRRYLKLSPATEANKQNRVVNQLVRWRQAVQYHEAGILFRKREFDYKFPHSLLDIKFAHGILDLPCLPIDQRTGCLFRNLIAFEQSSPQFGNYFTAYAAFMSQLLGMASDVTLLSRRGIIVHHMRSDQEVSILFTKLGKNVDFDPNGRCYLKSIWLAMEEHYQNRLNRWMAWLWQNHFSNPWLSLAALAALIVLICTILQSLFALLSYIKLTM